MICKFMHKKKATNKYTYFVVLTGPFPQCHKEGTSTRLHLLSFLIGKTSEIDQAQKEISVQQP